MKGIDRSLVEYLTFVDSNRIYCICKLLMLLIGLLVDLSSCKGLTNKNNVLCGKTMCIVGLYYFIRP